MKNVRFEDEDRDSPQETGTQAPAPAVEGEGGEASAPDALAAERDRLEQEKAALYDQLLRKQAEFENYRKRTEREKKEHHAAAAMEVIRAILPVLDGLERAVNLQPVDGTRGAEADNGRELHKGMELLQKQFLKTLEKLGLAPIATQGRKFDPHVHHAVEMVESEEHEDQSILQELQRGYLFHERLLRPAMVRVTTKPGKSKKN